MVKEFCMKYNGNLKSLKEVSGVYKILCLTTGKFYIGSSWNLKKRFGEHLNDLKRGEHSSRHLNHAWNKYGADDFVFSVVETTEESVRLAREQYYLDTLRPYERGIGFNNSPTAQSIRGIKRTPEFIEKIIASHERCQTVKQIVDPNGKIHSFRNTKRFARENGLSGQALSYVLNGSTRYTKGGWHLPNTELPLYQFLSPTKERISVLHMTLSAFCRERGLHFGHMRLVATGKKLAYKGWTHGSREDLFVDLIGPNEETVSVCSKSYTWFRKKYGLNQGNFSALMRRDGGVSSVKGWRLRETNI